MMNNANNLDSIAGNLVEHHMPALGKAPQAWRYIIPPSVHLWVVSQIIETRKEYCQGFTRIIPA